MPTLQDILTAIENLTAAVNAAAAQAHEDALVAAAKVDIVAAELNQRGSGPSRPHGF